MKKARFILIGYGWRADFFYRIANALPEQFEICAGVLRTKERARQVSEERQVFATDDLNEALAKKPDFAVLCVPRAIVKDYLLRLMDTGIPVLCETPPGQNEEELRELWAETEKRKGRIQVAEQYFLQPYYAGALEIVRAGYLGDISSVMRFLGGFMNWYVVDKKYIKYLIQFDSRVGYVEYGEKLKLLTFA